MTNLTEYNITDEQIREFHDALSHESDKDGVIHEVCRVALYAPLGSLRRLEARGTVAELINERNEK